METKVDNRGFQPSESVVLLVFNWTHTGVRVIDNVYCNQGMLDWHKKEGFEPIAIFKLKKQGDEQKDN